MGGRPLLRGGRPPLGGGGRPPLGGPLLDPRGGGPLEANLPRGGGPLPSGLRSGGPLPNELRGGGPLELTGPRGGGPLELTGPRGGKSLELTRPRGGGPRLTGTDLTGLLSVFTATTGLYGVSTCSSSAAEIPPFCDTSVIASTFLGSGKGEDSTLEENSA